MQQLVVTNIGPTGTFGFFIFKVVKPATCLLLVTQLLTLTDSISIYGGRIWTDTPYTHFLGLFLHNRVFTDCLYPDNSLLCIGAPARFLTCTDIRLLSPIVHLLSSPLGRSSSPAVISSSLICLD